jgi:hypothetical protein
MKNLLAILIMLPCFAIAQNNCTIKKTKDQFSQEPKLSTGFIELNTGSLSVDADSREIDFFFVLKNLNESKCFDDGSAVSVQFDSSRSKLNFRNTGTMNCEGLFHFTFKNAAVPPSALQRLATKKVTSFTITGRNDVQTVITLTEKQKEQLMQMVSCLLTETKTLRSS